MLEKIVSFFTLRHLLTNLIFIGVIIGGIYSWQNIKKEEMPDVTFDQIRISAVYPGASAEEVEHFVTIELEKAVKGIDGVYQITSSASQGRTTVTVELEKEYSNKDEAITEIKNAAFDAKLPEEVRDKPTVRVFKTSKKAIIEIALTHKDVHLLNTKKRKILQQYALSLENQLINIPYINSVNKSGYWQEEIQINIDPQKLKKFNIPLSKIKKVISENHARLPAGHLESKNEPRVTINAQLNSVRKLNKLYIQAGFEGRAIKLSEVAEVRNSFAREKRIIKVNGREAILFRVVKNSSFGILESIDAVSKTVEQYKGRYLTDTTIEIILLDDESIDVRNRLSIILINGAIGFTLILLMLFIFLNKRSGLWVGIGIPFTICFTLICGLLLGYTINNITLAAIIIVMGIVVDDAIVIAENIGRFRLSGANSYEASVKGTVQVFLPVVASIVTTCIAFIPLLFSAGRYSRLNTFIPPVIFLMLAASLFESLFILPGHMRVEIPALNNSSKSAKNITKKNKKLWFDKMEKYYGLALEKILPYKYLALLIFIIFLFGSLLIMSQKMKFVMFPNEETREIVLSGTADKMAERYETAALTKKIEDILKTYLGKEVVAIRTEIAKSRRGGAVEENKFRMIVEILPKEKRKKSADELTRLWHEQIKNIKGLNKFIAQKSRWGHVSGSPIEIIVQENDDKLREEASNKLAELLKNNPSLINIDIERPVEIPEYKIDYQREKIKRLSINPTDISSTFRSSLEGTILYTLSMGDNEIDVRLSIKHEAKTNIEKILDIPVENNRDYLVPLKDVVKIYKTKTPESISRRDSRRITTVYADIKQNINVTPIEIAEYIEINIFPKIISSQPSTTLGFTGEVYDTRQTEGDLATAVIIVTLLIFAVLSILFNSLLRPLIIMIAIPFGIVGVILAFWVHGKILFGFYAAIGCLGLAGVVINDSIIMVTKLDAEFHLKKEGNIKKRIAATARTRLKAVVLTTFTTVAGVLPTAYGLAGYDAMLAEMMLALAWGLLFGAVITLVLVPCLYCITREFKIPIWNIK